MFIHCLLLLPFLWGVSGRSFFCFAVLNDRFSFAIISREMKELVALLLLCSKCHVSVIVILTIIIIGTASANSVKFRGIRSRMYIEDLL